MGIPWDISDCQPPKTCPENECCPDVSSLSFQQHLQHHSIEWARREGITKGSGDVNIFHRIHPGRGPPCTPKSLFLFNVCSFKYGYFGYLSGQMESYFTNLDFPEIRGYPGGLSFSDSGSRHRTHLLKSPTSSCLGGFSAGCVTWSFS